jgi:hypothetical protein
MVSIQPFVVKQNGVVMSVAAASAMKKSVGKRIVGNTSMNMFFVK